MNELLAVAGRFHPLLLHLPIGLIAALAALEFLGVLRRTPPPLSVISTLALLTQLSAALAIATGLLLEQEGGYPEALADRHRNFALAFFAVCVLIGRLAKSEQRRRLMRGAIVAALALIGVAGHLGGSITHGDEFLFAPLERRAEEKAVDRAQSAPENEVAAPAPAQPVASAEDSDPSAAPIASTLSTFEEHIAPFFAESCTGCHGESKRKGRLTMHTREGLERGGASGPAFVAGDAAGSLLLERMRLPLDDEDHMPPSDKPQPSAARIAQIEAWIAAGAPFEGRIELPAAPVDAAAPAPANSNAQASAPSPVSARELRAEPPPAALEALRARLAHVQPVSQDEPLLWIDFAAPAADIDDAQARELLEPLLDHIAELSLARTKVTDASAELAARMPHLRRLDLRATGVTDAGLAHLANAAELRELILAQTAVSDAGLDALTKLGKLERIVLWSTRVTPGGAQALVEARPGLALELGDEPAATALESEGEIKFTSDAPLPGAEALPIALAPVNSVCPVSGSPVNPKYAVVFGTKVVGFCCPNCPKEFWADPSAFEEKLK